MKTLDELMLEAEHDWRSEVRVATPLWANTRIRREKGPLQPDNSGWDFWTDLKDISVFIDPDNTILSRLARSAQAYWLGQPEDLAKEALHYLLYHELDHRIYAPSSINGENNDRALLNRAIHDGLLKAEPSLRPIDQLRRAQAAYACVVDLIVDNMAFLDNRRRRHYREDIMPIVDFLGLENKAPATDIYTLTRVIYGYLYGPTPSRRFFAEKAGDGSVAIAQEALSALLGYNITLRYAAPAPVANAGTIFQQGGIEPSIETTSGIVERMGAIFTGPSRYDAIERFMAVLGRYTPIGGRQSRSDVSGEGIGGSPSDLLTDILDGMSPENQMMFINGLLEDTKAEDADPNAPPRPLEDIDIYGAHEYYKRNHPAVRITSGAKTGEAVSLGNQQYWHLISRTRIPEDQLSDLPLDEIIRLQQTSGIPWLYSIAQGLYQLDEYEIRQKSIIDVVYREATMDIPDVAELFLDGSLSMFHLAQDANGNLVTIFRVGDDSSWDRLSSVAYGYIDALNQAERICKKVCSIRLHNFASSTVDSDALPTSRFWAGDQGALKVLFKPDNGYTTELNLPDYPNDNLKRVIIIATDGGLSTQGVSREAAKIGTISRQRNTKVVYFDIGAQFNLGKAVSEMPGIYYRQVDDIQSMLKEGVEVLLSL